MFPTSGLGVGRVRDPKFQVALCRAYNDFISDYCKASPRLKAVANLPVNDPAECVRELNRAVTKLGLCGGMMVAQAHRKNLGSAEYYPLYEEAQKLNTPLTIHAFGGDEPGSEIFDQFISLHTCGHPFPGAASIDGDGVRRHPRAVSKSPHRLSRSRLRLAALLGRAHGRGVGEARQSRERRCAKRNRANTCSARTATMAASRKRR